jgi:plastocyanin
MKFTSFLVVLLLSCFASAGTLSGTVQAKGDSAVVLETIPAKTFPATKQIAAVDQRGMVFAPGLLVIQQGTTVIFSNSDSVPHNVFWPNISGNKKLGHNLGVVYKKGKPLSFKYDNPGYVSLLCNVHPEMFGTIVVSPSPYFAKTDASGNYSIADVPDGQYKATAWHNGKPATQNVSVKGSTKLDFTAVK